MLGRSSKAMPGAVTRLGPANRTGLARSDQTGSTTMFRPATWMSTEACPTIVTASPSTRCCGRVWRTANELRPVFLVAAHAPAQQVRE